MRDRIRRAFDAIHAEEQLKTDIKTYIARKTREYPLQKVIIPPLGGICCMLDIFDFFRGGCYLYFVPTAVISIDINPSIELEINRFNKVVQVKNYNKDGEELSEELDIRFLNYSQAVENILNNTTIINLLSQDELLSITVISNQEQSEKMLSELQIYTAGNRNVYCCAVSSDAVAEAHEEGMSYGKYRAYLELRELDERITTEQIKDMSMKEIREMIQVLSGDRRKMGNDPRGMALIMVIKLLANWKKINIPFVVPPFKNFLKKKIKKVVDKGEEVWYYRRALKGRGALGSAGQLIEN